MKVWLFFQWRSLNIVDGLSLFQELIGECNSQIAYPSEVEGFAAQLLKVQDNIPICASIISQHLALYSLEAGPEWVMERVKTLIKNREIVVDALAPLGEGAVKGGEGAIYLWAKLPDKFVHDFDVVRWLAHRHGVVTIPGSACGCPGNLRISFGGLVESDCRAAAEKLKRGLEELVRDGMVQWVVLLASDWNNWDIGVYYLICATFVAGTS